MKSLSQRREHGSVLLITMITCGVITIVMASYLALISSRHNVTVRSMAWNAAMPVLEAGLEEALTHLQVDTNSPTANGWTAATIGGQPVHQKQRTNSDGSYYSAKIYDYASANPKVYSTGFVPAPLGNGYISRTVRITTTKPSSFPAGIAANGLVTLSGGAIVDSYNSCQGAYSTNNSLGTNAAIATNFQGNPAVKVGTAHVYGQVVTGPLGIVTVAGGAVGDKTWNATSTGIQPGWSDNDMNVAFPTNAPPTGTPFPPPAIIVAGGSNITQLVTGNFQLASFVSSSSTKPMFVTGNAVLYVTGNVTVSGSGYIKIFPGASLKLIVGGQKFVVSGGGVVNGTQQAANFTYIGLPTNTEVTYSGSAAFIGTVNAPQVDFTISGSAGMYGAAIVQKYTSSGGSSFHYDDCLGAGGSLTVASWQEM